jgi:hypothetical protein
MPGYNAPYQKVTIYNVLVGAGMLDASIQRPASHRMSVRRPYTDEERHQSSYTPGICPALLATLRHLTGDHSDRHVDDAQLVTPC